MLKKRLLDSCWQYHLPRSFQRGPPYPVHIVFKKAEKPECNVKPLWQYCAMLGHAEVSPMLFHQVIQFVLHEYALCFMILVSIRFALLCVALHCFALLCIALLCFAVLCCALRCFALLCVALRCFALLCIALHCFAVQAIISIIISTTLSLYLL